MKNKRQATILHLVAAQQIHTQGELTLALAQAGYTATQATISRDIRELRLTKEIGYSGLARYIAPREEDISPMTRVLRTGLVSANYAGYMLVLKTRIGMGMAVATALDEMKYDEILGTVAGDDTVFCVIKTEIQAAQLKEEMEQLVRCLPR